MAHATDSHPIIGVGKIDGIMAALPALDRDAAAQLLFEILLLFNSTTVLTHLRASTLPASKQHELQRAMLIGVIERHTSD